MQPNISITMANGQSVRVAGVCIKLGTDTRFVQPFVGNLNGHGGLSGGAQVGDLFLPRTGTDPRYRCIVGGSPFEQLWAPDAPLGAALPSSLDLDPKSGEYLLPAQVSGLSTRVLVAGDSGSIWYQRVDVTGSGLTVADVVAGCTSAQSGGTCVYRGGIYPDDGTGSRPAAALPIADAAFGVFTSTGDKLAATATTLPVGVYWVAFGYFETAAPTTRATVRDVTGGIALPITALSTGLGPAWKQTGYTGGALPAAAPGSLSVAGTPPLVALVAT